MVAPSPWPCQNGRMCFTRCPGCPGPFGRLRSDARELPEPSVADDGETWAFADEECPDDECLKE